MTGADAYERLVRPTLFSIDPERAHDLAIRTLCALSRSRAALRPLAAFQPRAKPIELFGLTFRNVVGLAAGFDKNGVALPAWEALGFGFVEIGTVTAKAQPGNPKPRIFRVPEQQALINRLGFNNDGADMVATRLRRLREGDRWPGIPVGINIGKSKGTALEAATEDYLYSFRRLGEFADYVVLNVSSPNTPGLRSLQGEAPLAELLGVIQDANGALRKPLLVKIAPDISAAQLEGLLAVCEANGVAGLIATNTTLDHSSVAPARDQSGGLSGVPLREKSTDLIRGITARSSLPVIGVGGVADRESAREKLAAGARLLQVYTGFIYRGPALLREIAEGISKTSS
ncbi:MAG: quinone-dependent dihydroorotate dehydrogenase [Verrucomicrobiota bacterium]|nr:quinone-dependent dihydroorotate dehydrogenase [Verrucomicrobiota bacterium]